MLVVQYAGDLVIWQINIMPRLEQLYHLCLCPFEHQGISRYKNSGRLLAFAHTIV